MERLSAQHNAGNPWRTSSLTRDKLRGRAGWWKAIGADRTVLSWILCGARLPEVVDPLPLEFKNHPSYLENEAFVDLEIAHAVAEGTFRVISEHDARIVNPISVEHNKEHTKLRMCVDARWHNAHLPRVRFTLESLETHLADVVKPNDHMLTTDISRAYYSVPIVEEATPKLAVRHRGVLYAPTVLPFGSSLAPFIFNKITRQVVRFARFLGVQVLNFYDDFLWASEGKHGPALAKWVQWLLPASGWNLNDKCQWQPSTSRDFLGFLIDTANFSLHVKAERISRAEEALKELKKRDMHQPIPLSPFESLVGQISSMRPAIAAVGVFTRALYRAVTAARDAGSQSVTLDDRARAELDFWHSDLKLRNGCKIVPPAAMIEWRVDASETAIGAHETNSTRRFSEALPANMIGRSSTHRELYGVLRAVKRWAHLHPHRTIRLCLDSYTATRNLIKGGGPIQDLCDLTKTIWRESAELHKVSLFPEWVRREDNSTADKLSKAWENWYLMSDAGKLALHAARRAAPAQYAQLAVTNVPFNQVQNVIQHHKAARSAVCLIHPQWTAQSWWPVRTGARKWDAVLGATQDVLSSDPNDTAAGSIPLSDKPRWQIMASILDFKA